MRLLASYYIIDFYYIKNGKMTKSLTEIILSEAITLMVDITLLACTHRPKCTFFPNTHRYICQLYRESVLKPELSMVYSYNITYYSLNILYVAIQLSHQRFLKHIHKILFKCRCLYF